MTSQHFHSTPRSRNAFLVVVLLLAVLFAGTLFDLFRFCLASDLYSYILLIPLVSGYLAGLQKTKFPGADRRVVLPGLVLLSGGLLALAAAWAAAAEDRLSLKILALVLLFTGVCALFLGRARLRLLAFPLAFLVFMIPLPPEGRASVETFLQYGSAAAANGMFTLSGVPVFQDGISFHLPNNVKFNVEPECSGIHSSLVLLITSLVAAHLLLRTFWKQALLCAVVLPLALVRNGFRIYVLGELCLRYGMRMLDTWIHHHGGPIFFALSLIPFFGLLLWLIKSERAGQSASQKPGVAIKS